MSEIIKLYSNPLTYNYSKFYDLWTLLTRGVEVLKIDPSSPSLRYKREGPRLNEIAVLNFLKSGGKTGGSFSYKKYGKTASKMYRPFSNFFGQFLLSINPF